MSSSMRTATTQRVPVLLLALAGASAAAVAAVLAAAPAARVGGPAQRLSAGCFVAGMLLLACVGYLIAHRRPQERVVGVLLLAGGAVALAGRAVIAAVLAAPSDVPAALAWASNWAWVPGAGAAMIVLLRFPSGALPSPRWRWLERTALAWTALAVLVTALVPGPLALEQLSRENPLGLTGTTWWDDLLAPVFGLLPLLTVACCAALPVRYRRAPADERQQLRWVVAAVGVVALATPVASIGDAGALLESVAYLLLPAAIAVAVLRHRLYDLGLVLRRTVAYAWASGLLLGAYVAVVSVSQSALEGRAPDLVATAVVAVLAVPILTGVQRVLERLLFGERREPDRVVAALAQRLASTPEALLPQVVEQVAASLRLPYVAVVLADGTVAAQAGTASSVAVRVPLVHGGARVGELLAGARTPGETLGGRDMVLLERVAAHAGLAVHSTLLGVALQHSLERVRLTREAERRRLRRELHDELGPALGAISMRAEAAENLLVRGAGTAQVQDVLRSVQASAADAVVEVRRILDELEPGVLGERGLPEALRQVAAGVPDGLDVQLDVRLPPVLPAEVASAAYRICGEALRNVVRHAGATKAGLSLRVRDGALHVTVTDDGVGLPAQPRPGIGLPSMRARAEELGGTLDLVPGAGGGTAVVAALPVPTS